MNAPTQHFADRTTIFADRGDVPLVDLLDRLLETGVAASGDIVLSVAGIDLVWLSLRAVLKGIDGAEADLPLARGATEHEGTRRPRGRAVTPRAVTGQGDSGRDDYARGPRDRDRDTRARRLGIDQSDVDRGLVQLVLTVVELLKELMERQAVRRAEGPGLSDQAVEELGLALMRLDERMQGLKAHFGLTDDDVRPRLRALAEVS